MVVLIVYLVQFVIGIIAWKRTRIFGLGDAFVFSALVLPNIILLSVFISYLFSFLWRKRKITTQKAFEIYKKRIDNSKTIEHLPKSFVDSFNEAQIKFLKHKL